MGSSSSYSANSGLIIPIKKKEKNSKEVINLLLNKHIMKKNILADFNGEDFENIEEEFLEIIKNNVELGINLTYGYCKEDNDALKLPKTIEQALKVIKNKIESYSEIFEIYCFIECNEEDLEFVNLEVVEIANIKILSEEFNFNFLNVGESIYCDSDNNSFSKKSIDEKFIKLVNIPGACIYLSGEGSCD